MSARGYIGMLVAVSGAAVAGRLAPVNARAATQSPTRVVLAGGCYWGVESVFRHVRGVTSVVSGFAVAETTAGTASAAPAEAVVITYDASRISYREILDVFFSVVHDPTQRDKQGPDEGAEYRSIVFVDGGRQRELVRGYIDSLSAAHVYASPIVTEIAALQSFQPVGADQQDYAARHPTDPYIVVNDAPKLEALKRKFPRLYRQ